MRPERGAVPALIVVLALIAAFAVAAFVLLTGEGADAAGPDDGEALAMTGDEAAAPGRGDGRAGATEREASEAEELPEEAPDDEAAEAPDEELPPDATGLTGRVLDRSGRPAAGVEVTVSRIVPRERLDEFGVELEDGEPTGRFERRVTADEEGRFTAIELVAESDYRVEVETDDGRLGRKHGLTVIEALVQDVGDVPLRDGARVRGRVRTEGGAPVEGARVRFGWSWGSEPIVSGEDGRFDAGVLFPGRHQIRVSADGYALAENLEREFVEGDDVDDLVLVVVRAAPIRGRIVDGAGRGVADAWINANREGRTMFSWFHEQVRSEADGSFAFESIPAGDYDLNAGKEGFRQASLDDVTAGGPPVEMKLRRAGTIRGVVLDATGAPVKAEKVRLLWVPPWRKDDPNAEPTEYHGARPAECDEQGAFSIGLDDGGTFVAEAFAEGYSPGRSTRFELEENGTAAGVVVRVERGLTLTIRAVEDVTQRPVAGAVVDLHVAPDGNGGAGATPALAELGYISNGSFLSAAGPGRPGLGERIAQVVTGEDGEAVCDSVFPGSFVAVARKHGHAPARVEGIAVVRGETPAPVELSFAAGGAITGTVTNDRGAVEPALHVYASNDEGRAGEAVTGPDGVYRIEHLAPGRYAVEAENPDASTGRRGFFMGHSNDGKQLSEAEKYPLVVEEGRTVTKDLVIERVVPGQLAGTVLINGSPRSDVGVMANRVREDGQVEWSWGNQARTDELGNFRFRRLSPGRYDLLVTRTWSQMYEGGEATVTAGSESLVTLDVGLGAITGVVVDGDGRPIEGVDVRAQRRREGKGRFFFGGSDSDRTGPDGSFRIEELQAGAFDLRVRKQGYVTRSLEEVVVHARRETANGRVELEAGGWIRVAVVRGRQGARYRVSGQLPGADRERHQWIRLDEAGAGWVEVGEAEGSGEMTVTERAENPRSTTVPVTLAKGSVAEVSVSFD